VPSIVFRFRGLFAPLAFFFFLISLSKLICASTTSAAHHRLSSAIANVLAIASPSPRPPRPRAFSRIRECGFALVSPSLTHV
jgi:hypothetical protein